MSLKSFQRKYANGNSARITVSVVREDSISTPADTPERLYEFWQNIIAWQPDHEPEKESLVVILMNTKLNAYAWHRVSLGTINETLIHPREVFRPVITGGAYAFSLMHNHPSGDPNPSPADHKVTRRMKDCATMMNIRFIDHCIIGEKAQGRLPYFSFLDAGLI